MTTPDRKKPPVSISSALPMPGSRGGFDAATPAIPGPAAPPENRHWRYARQCALPWFPLPAQQRGGLDILQRTYLVLYQISRDSHRLASIDTMTDTMTQKSYRVISGAPSQTGPAFGCRCFLPCGQWHAVDPGRCESYRASICVRGNVAPRPAPGFPPTNLR